MSVKLRLMRTGRRGQPAYRIVAVDSRKRRDGAYLEKIGHYNPLTRPAELVLDGAKALKWLKCGAVPSDTVRSLLSRGGLLLEQSLMKKGVAEDEIKARVAQFRQTKEAALRAKEQQSVAAATKKRTVAAAAKEAPEPPAAEPSIEVPPSEPAASGDLASA